MYCMDGKLVYGIMYGHDDMYFLGWQKPAWDESGYFWARIDTFKKILHNNTHNHPFLFESREEAVKHLKSLHIKQFCSIIPIFCQEIDNDNDDAIINEYAYPGICIEAANSIWGCGRRYFTKEK